MQPDRAATRALQLSRGLFGAGRARAIPDAPPKPDIEETDEKPGGIKHLFGR